MSERLLLLCPGQGGQHPGMFDLARTDPGAKLMLDSLALPAAQDEQIFTNQTAQPLIVAATVAMWAALRPHAPTPSLVAGYSIGELSAWCVAGAVDPVDAVALARLRAAAMDNAAAGATHAMLSVDGLALATLGQIAGECGFSVAITTGEDSCIAGGPAAQATQLEARLQALGARVHLLPVAIAAHTPMMEDACAPYAAALERTAFRSPACAVLSGTAAQALTSKQQAVAHLSRQLADTIHWEWCMDAAAEAGIGVALELGPGAALARMLRARHPHIECRSVADFRSIDGVVRWLHRHSS